MFGLRSQLWIAISCTVALSFADDLPQQIHIAFAGADSDGNPNGMTVSWQTVYNTVTSIVKYGKSPSSLTSIASGSSSTYYVTYDHHVVLKNLQPSMTYYYQCGNQEAGWSEVLSFTTAPSQSTIQYPTNIAIIGDMGMYYSEDTRATLQDMANNGDYEWIWHLGDVGYADDDWLHEPLKDGYEDAYNEYMNAIQGFVAELPYMVLVGNHEAECHSPACETSKEKLEHLSNFSAYNSRFRMPSPESSGNSNMWYSFNYGPIHFININTETNYEGAPGDHYTWYGDNGNFWGDQVAWLEADLQRATSERSIRPWILVGGHRPIYTVDDCNPDGSPRGVGASLQAAVEDLFYEYKVDSYWAGHKHAYERQWPVYNNSNVQQNSNYVDAPYPVHIINGAAGNDEKLSVYNDPPAIAWNAMYDTAHYGMGILTLNSATSMTWTYFDVANGEVHDKVAFSKTQ